MSDDTPARDDAAGQPRPDTPGELNWDSLITGGVPQQKPIVTETPPSGLDAIITGETPQQPRSRREAREQETARAGALLAADPTVGSSRAERRAQRSDLYPEQERKRRGPLIGCLVVVLVLVLAGVGGWFALQGPIQQFISSQQGPADYKGDGTGEALVTIKEGDIGEDIAHTLHDSGVTASVDSFYKLLLSKAEQPVFQPGVYKLKQKMSAKAALAALQDPANRMENTVVVPEGEVAADVYQSIADGLGIPLADVQAAAANPAAYGLPAEATSLEGFLFPATYTFDPGTSAQDAIKAMVDRSFQALDDAGVAPEDRWKTVVLAALVQKEAGLRDDYYKVSRVFLNRLDPGQWPSGLLQSDATVAYGTGNTHRVATTDAERADASNPYNTYVHPGLPVGPISNPGDLAIDAALHPADGPWLYFVTWNLDTGETIFSTTSDEHDAAVQKWLDWMDQHPEYQ